MAGINMMLRGSSIATNLYRFADGVDLVIDANPCEEAIEDFFVAALK